jgi:hypothetical protein
MREHLKQMVSMQARINSGALVAEHTRGEHYDPITDESIAAEWCPLCQHEAAVERLLLMSIHSSSAAMLDAAKPAAAAKQSTRPTISVCVGEVI